MERQYRINMLSALHQAGILPYTVVTDRSFAVETQPLMGGSVWHAKGPPAADQLNAVQIVEIYEAIKTRTGVDDKEMGLLLKGKLALRKIMPEVTATAKPSSATSVAAPSNWREREHRLLSLSVRPPPSLRAMA